MSGDGKRGGYVAATAPILDSTGVYPERSERAQHDSQPAQEVFAYARSGFEDKRLQIVELFVTHLRGLVA